MKKSEWIVQLAVIAAAIAMFAVKHRSGEVSSDARDTANGGSLVVAGQSQIESTTQQEPDNDSDVQASGESDSAKCRQAKLETPVPGNRSKTVRRPAERETVKPSQPLTSDQKSAAVFR